MSTDQKIRRLAEILLLLIAPSNLATKGFKLRKAIEDLNTIIETTP